MVNPEEVLSLASGIDPVAAKALTASDLLLPPKFTGTVESEKFPAMNGIVILHYPNVGDELAIERVVRGGGSTAYMLASFAICIDKAPDTWWKLPKGGLNPNSVPILDLESLMDIDALWSLWGAFSEWKARFRSGSN